MTEHLREMLDPLPEGSVLINAGPFGKRREALPDRFRCGAFKLLPLVTEDLHLVCELDVLMLRPDAPGSLVKSGDIDGRLKTLFDALQIPGVDANQLGNATPSEDEEPFYCLLENDKLISQLKIQTDLLLEKVSEPADPRQPLINVNDVRLVITVRLRPADARYATINFWS